MRNRNCLHCLFPIRWNLSVVGEADAQVETFIHLCGFREVFRIIFAFIEMYLLTTYHCIRRFAGEGRTIIEGVEKASNFRAICEEILGNGSQCCAAIEGISETG